MVSQTLIGFALAFAGGPLIVAALLRLSPQVAVLVALSSAVIIAAALAAWMVQRFPLGALISIWLGWLLALALVAQTVRRRLPGRKTRFVTGLAALLAAPLPWFGLATAQMVD